MLQKFHAGSNSDSGVQYRSMIQMHMILWCRPSIRLLAVLALCLDPVKRTNTDTQLFASPTFPAFRQSDGLDHTSTGCRTLRVNCGKQLASRASTLFWVLRNTFAPPPSSRLGCSIPKGYGRPPRIVRVYLDNAN